MRILIADDDSVSRSVLKALLRKGNHDVLEAVNGVEAWKLFQIESPAVIISDWMMPELDGLRLCRLIRGVKRRRYPYIILVTVLSGKGSHLEGLAAGADDFLIKPFDEDLLVARLHVAGRILQLQNEVESLQGLLPICQYCKRIRDSEENWIQVETYVAARSQADFTHGICPQCMDTYVRPQLVGLKRR